MSIRSHATRFAVIVASIAVPISDASAQDPVAAAKQLTCDELFARVTAAYKALPAEYRGMSNAAAKELGERVQQTLVECRDYLSRCRALDAAKTAAVEFYFAQNLFLLSAQYRAGLIDRLRKESEETRTSFPSDRLKLQMTSYYETLARSAQSAFDGLPADSELRPLALKIVGQAQSGAEDHIRARDSFKMFLDKFADHEDVPAITTALARAYLELDQYDEGIEFTRKAQKDRKIYNSPSYPYLGEALWKLHEAKGDAQGMLTSARAALVLYELRLADAATTSFLREDYERFIIFHGFRVGYAQFALGAFDEARSSFRDYVDSIDAKGRAAQEKGGDLPPYARIYQKRARDCLEFIEHFVHQPPPADLDLAGLWATDERVGLVSDLGKVIAIVFRGTEDERSAPFLEGLSAFCRGEPEIELVTISFLKGATNPQQQVDELREELDKIDYSGAAGVDPDAEKKSLFRAFHANVGSATFIIYGRDGTAAWFQQDPREVDVNLAIAMLKRLRGAK